MREDSFCGTKPVDLSPSSFPDADTARFEAAYGRILEALNIQTPRELSAILRVR